MVHIAILVALLVRIPSCTRNFSTPTAELQPVAAGVLLMVCFHCANLRVGTFRSSTEQILTQARATLHIGEYTILIVQELFSSFKF